MNSDPLSPLQEFIAQRADIIAAGAKEDGGNGSMCRLMQRIDTINVTDWIDEESKRGATSDEIGNALANYVANLIAPWCLLGGKHSVLNAGELLKDSLRSFLGLVSGECETEVVAVHVETGHEIVGTAAGFARQGVPKP